MKQFWLSTSPVKILIFLNFLFLGWGNSFSDNSETIKRFKFSLKEMDFISGFGKAKIEEGDYKTIPFSLQFGTDSSEIFKNFNKKNDSLMLYMEPQINSVSSPEKDYEFALGVGIKYMKFINYPISFSLKFSTGPGYISVKTQTQRSGFAFFSNFDMGFYFFVAKGKAIQIGYRFRHISNANLRKPNLGINSHFAFIGLAFFY